MPRIALVLQLFLAVPYPQKSGCARHIAQHARVTRPQPPPIHHRRRRYHHHSTSLSRRSHQPCWRAVKVRRRRRRPRMHAGPEPHADAGTALFHACLHPNPSSDKTACMGYSPILPAFTAPNPPYSTNSGLRPFTRPRRGRVDRRCLCVVWCALLEEGQVSDRGGRCVANQAAVKHAVKQEKPFTAVELWQEHRRVCPASSNCWQRVWKAAAAWLRSRRPPRSGCC